MFVGEGEEPTKAGVTSSDPFMEESWKVGPCPDD